MNSPAPHFQLGQISQIALTVEDLDKSVSFYRDVLGLKHLFSAPPAMAFFAAGNVRLMLSRPEGPGSEKSTGALYFGVPDMDLAFHELSSRGVRFERDPHLVARMPDHELWMAFLRDPDRNLLALMCEKRG